MRSEPVPLMPCTVANLRREESRAKGSTSRVPYQLIFDDGRVVTERKFSTGLAEFSYTGDRSVLFVEVLLGDGLLGLLDTLENEGFALVRAIRTHAQIDCEGQRCRCTTE